MDGGLIDRKMGINTFVIFCNEKVDIKYIVGLHIHCTHGCFLPWMDYDFTDHWSIRLVWLNPVYEIWKGKQTQSINNGCKFALG